MPLSGAKDAERTRRPALLMAEPSISKSRPPHCAGVAAVLAELPVPPHPPEGFSCWYAAWGHIRTSWSF